MKRVYELDVFVQQADPPRRNKLAEYLSEMSADGAIRLVSRMAEGAN